MTMTTIVCPWLGIDSIFDERLAFDFQATAQIPNTRARARVITNSTQRQPVHSGQHYFVSILVQAPTRDNPSPILPRSQLQMNGLLFPLIYGYKYTNEAIPDLSGKIAIVTGGNTGIGYETTYELLRKGAKVYLAARSESRATDAIKKLEAAKLPGSVQWLKIDLQDLASVKTAAKEFTDQESRLDMLFLNAGVMAGPYSLSATDGLESQIQTNHISQFLFANLLVPKLESSGDPRVVVTSSAGHQMFSATAESFTSVEQLNGTFGSTWKRYGQSKLANILFAQGLAERHPKILANSCHPGMSTFLIHTSLLC